MNNKMILIITILCCLTYFFTAFICTQNKQFSDNDRYSIIKNDNEYILLDKKEGATWGWVYDCGDKKGCWVRMRKDIKN